MPSKIAFFSLILYKSLQLKIKNFWHRSAEYKIPSPLGEDKISIYKR